MKSSIAVCLLGISLCMSSCILESPTYFGTRLQPTIDVQVYYAGKDINKPYKVIGRMVSAISSSERDQERVKNSLIAMAKKVGADGLIFSDITREAHQKNSDDISIKAEAIVFTVE
ncbi:MAG: hypothetical protein V4594_24075 [Bacteroidota bacterium]